MEILIEAAEGRTFADKLLACSFLLSAIIVGWKLAG